jgi:plastocyanin
MKTAKFTLIILVLGILSLASLESNATKWIVNVQNFSFSPTNLPNVAVGDTIRWVWVSGTHTTTSTTIPFGATSWDHPITSSNTFFEYKVTVAGDYDYKCTPHEGMGMVGAFTATALTPLLVSIVPNQAVQGDSFNATITGTNTNFNGSPSVSLSFSNNPGEIINASSVTVISPTVLHAQFTIPANASAGLWDVHVNSLILDNGFTVILSPPAILAINPFEANQGVSFTGTITGQNTGWSGTPEVSLSFSGDPTEIINGTNVVVLNSTHLTADFSIPVDASPGSYDVNVNDLQQTNGFNVIETLTPALTGIVPDNGDQGYTVSTTITAENTSFGPGSPTVAISLGTDPSETIPGSNVVVINSTTLTADFNIPVDATPGSWDLNVDDLTLQNSFTVNELNPAILSIVPDSAYQGEVVLSKVTAEDTRFTVTEPSVSISFSNNPGEIIFASNVSIINDTELNAVFDIPAGASVGKWDLHVGTVLLAEGFTVNLLTGIDDPAIAIIRTFPNPASNRLFIENATGSYASFYTESGKLILSERITSESQAIDISHLAHGLYIIRLRLNGSERMEKLLIN